MAQLSHPNVVGVHAAVAWEGRVVLAMELVEGTSLGRWLEEGVPEWREVIDVLAAAGRGLAAAHDAGLVHRDFKAQSVGTDGRARRVCGPPSAAAAGGSDGDRVEARIREVAASRGEHHEDPRDEAPGSHQRAGGDRGAQGGARHHHGTGSSMTTKASRHLKREESVSLAWRRVLKDGPSAQPGVLDSAYGTRALAATARVLPANTVWNEWVAAETLTNLAHLSSTMGVQGECSAGRLSVSKGNCGKQGCWGLSGARPHGGTGESGSHTLVVGRGAGRGRGARSTLPPVGVGAAAAGFDEAGSRACRDRGRGPLPLGERPARAVGASGDRRQPAPGSADLHQRQQDRSPRRGAARPLGPRRHRPGEVSRPPGLDAYQADQPRPRRREVVRRAYADLCGARFCSQHPGTDSLKTSR
jgi:hypothetical protein